eukprot:IDg20476t1
MISYILAKRNTHEFGFNTRCLLTGMYENISHVHAAMLEPRFSAALESFRLNVGRPAVEVHIPVG